jgi:menaquinone-dependent protoporphyrinogen oxidase
MNVLVTAASREGATTEIAAAIADRLRKGGLDTAVVEPDSVVDVRSCDAFVIGSAVYAGHWLQPATQLVDRFGAMLAARPVWLFSSGPVGDPSRKLVRTMGADPIDLPSLRAQTNARDHRLFAGRLVGPNGGLAQRWATTIADELLADDRSRSLETEILSPGTATR